jgi:hypothetical protein
VDSKEQADQIVNKALAQRLAADATIENKDNEHFSLAQPH